MSYHNLFKTEVIRSLLQEATNAGKTILDVGGGVAPWHGASHIIDLQPFDEKRLTTTAWGGQRKQPWHPALYSEFDICSGRWPFADRVFDIGYASGVLEDLRDPLFVANEMQRICRRVVIESPSRLCEQTRGIEHQRWTGFWHHRWMLSEHDGALLFQRKTPLLDLPGCHHRLQPWQSADISQFIIIFNAPVPFAVREVAYWSEQEERDNLTAFVAGTQLHKTFDTDFKHMIYRFKQKFFATI